MNEHLVVTQTLHSPKWRQCQPWCTSLRPVTPNQMSLQWSTGWEIKREFGFHILGHLKPMLREPGTCVGCALAWFVIWCWGWFFIFLCVCFSAAIDLCQRLPKPLSSLFQRSSIGQSWISSWDDERWNNTREPVAIWFPCQSWSTCHKPASTLFLTSVDLRIKRLQLLWTEGQSETHSFPNRVFWDSLGRRVWNENRKMTIYDEWPWVILGLFSHGAYHFGILFYP